MSSIPLVGPLGKMSRRFAAVTLFFQSFALFFGALAVRGLAHARGDDFSTWYLVGGCVLAVLCLVTMVLLKSRPGVTVGWLLQLLTLACALVEPAMLAVGVIFLVIWVLALWQGDKMDALSRQFETGTHHVAGEEGR
ncbi:Protein of unknown function [Kytococcus aerolatus]|uniref:DUF4233 domain-containing protein n=1 Tax=Kytococcus aerolatus TaxID=592308 RepID=A0A212U0L5_9MICO|nr:DUF4233 domain-containing protein [Kytococcus aerolatus]SNC71680.1 Protein of unknown function [Kytococcus aerolatus]